MRIVLTIVFGTFVVALVVGLLMYADSRKSAAIERRDAIRQEQHKETLHQQCREADELTREMNPQCEQFERVSVQTQ